MRSLSEAVGRALNDEVVRASAVHGGDTASAHRMELASGRVVFAKTHPDPPPQFFTTESASLRWLAEPRVLSIPDVLAVSDGAGDGGDEDELPHLVLGWITEGRPAATTEAQLGSSLAALHAAAPASFGRHDRRTTGSRRLPNEPCDGWAEFYATRRLGPLARLARDGDALDPASCRALDGLDADRLTELGGPPEPPARLHGDLWAGNRLVDTSGRNWLVDPAAHGGHREFDLAMMRLFGGFGPEAFTAYDEAWPLQAGWADRVALHQIVPLVVHAIRFGGGYPRAAAEAIATYA